MIFSIKFKNSVCSICIWKKIQKKFIKKKIPFINFENPLYFWLTLKSILPNKMALIKKVIQQHVSKIEFYFQIHLRQNSRCKISFSQESHRALLRKEKRNHKRVKVMVTHDIPCDGGNPRHSIFPHVPLASHDLPEHPCINPIRPGI
jgi:hypothetical protein